MMRNCLICGTPFELAPKANNTKFCDLHRSLTREIRKKLTPEQVIRGVPVLYPGCASWDRYSKKDFLYYLDTKQFPPGTEYILDGKRSKIDNVVCEC
jgi:hypothetical protein